MAERNYDLEKELLYKIMAENLEKRFEKTVSESDIDGQYSESFRKKMSRLIGADIKNPEKKVNNLKKYIVVGLIAAVVALAGCAILGKVLGPYVEEWFGTYMWIQNENDENEAKAIEKIYSLAYIPAEYEYIRENSASNMYVHIWKNSDNKILKFIQTTTSSDFYTDVEAGYSFLMENDGTEIYCKISERYHSYIWHNSEYKFEIISQEQISESEIKKMLDGITIKE